MICYFDTSALVPLLIAEPGTPRSRDLWEAADRVVSCHLIYVEAATALAQAERMKRLDPLARWQAIQLLDRLFDRLDIIAVDDALIHRAAMLAHDLALRGYDAVHCAAAERAASEDLVAASGDARLLAACASLGIATADTNPPRDVS